MQCALYTFIFGSTLTGEDGYLAIARDVCHVMSRFVATGQRYTGCQKYWSRMVNFFKYTATSQDPTVRETSTRQDHDACQTSGEYGNAWINGRQVAW